MCVTGGLVWWVVSLVCSDSSLRPIKRDSWDLYYGYCGPGVFEVEGELEFVGEPYLVPSPQQ